MTSVEVAINCLDGSRVFQKTPKSPAQAPEAMTTCSNAIESRHGSISPWDDVNFGGFFVSGFVGTTKNNGNVAANPTSSL